jgi:hypothetical protein
MPVYEDWECAFILCRALGEELRGLPQVAARVLLVDDGSPTGIAHWPRAQGPLTIQVEALRLRANLGHQRAICVGICYIYEHFPCDAVVVMDADGEDRAEDAVGLIKRALSKPSFAIFAERRRRSVGLLFKVGYNAFRVVHRLLTGIPVRVGNFSLIPRTLLPTLTCMPELWNHYAGAVVKSKARCDLVPMDRGPRLKGPSKMNLTALVMHGVSGIATFAETVATRILITNVIGLVFLGIVVAFVIWLRFCTNLAIPGWAAYSVGLILVLALQLLGVSFSLVFSLISNRTRMQVTPIRDYAIFVDHLQNLAGPQ